MMRRERPKQATRQDNEETVSRISMTAAGVPSRADAAFLESTEQSAGIAGENPFYTDREVSHPKAAAQKARAPTALASHVLQKLQKAQSEDNKQRSEVAPESAALAETSEASVVQTSTQRGVDERKRNPARLSDEDEELYRKLFPEDREQETKGAMSALEVSGQKTFRIKVPVAGGKKLCLTEENHGFNVKAEPCRKKSSRQKWYWAEGSKLKNLFSQGRCLGMEKKKHHIAFQTESLVQMEEAKAKHAKEPHHISMNFHCNDKHAPLQWEIDAMGRLKSASDLCMAVKENDAGNHDALALPCGAKVEVM